MNGGVITTVFAVIYCGWERAEQDSKQEVCSANSFSGSSRNQQGRRYDKTEATASSNFSSVHSSACCHFKRQRILL